MPMTLVNDDFTFLTCSSNFVVDDMVIPRSQAEMDYWIGVTVGPSITISKSGLSPYVRRMNFVICLKYM